MKKPTIYMAMGSGRDGWLYIDLDSLKFTLEIENGRRTEELLSLTELKMRHPNITGLVADVLAEAVRVNPK